jgi:uncharacterized protein DUF6152
VLNKRDNIAAVAFALWFVPTKDGRSPVKFLLALALAASGVIVSVPLFAHHGNASYDSTKTVTVKGTVTDYIWANPHVFLKVDAKDNSGNTLHWIIEAQNPLSQTEVGWTKNTFKPGDEVIVEIIPAKNGQPIGRFGVAGPTAGLATQESRIVINGKQFKP